MKRKDGYAFSTSRLQIRTDTWHRDSHGLFDYESKSLTHKTFKVAARGSLIRSEDTLGYLTSSWEEKCLEAKVEFLARISSKEAKITAAPPTWILQNPPNLTPLKSGKDNRIWLVVKSLSIKGAGYNLALNDVLKVGRIALQVTDLRTSSETSCKKEYELFVPQTEEKSTRNEISNCRFCLSSEATAENPLIAPCKCSGSVRLVHLDCLKQWLDSRKVSKSADNVTTYFWKHLDCELCKSPLPTAVQIQQKVVDLVNIPLPEGPCVRLDAIERQKVPGKIIHVVSFQDKHSAYIGRGHETEIRISDISVSRSHALLQYNHKSHSISLQDNESKFGTLVLLQRKLQIPQNSSLTFQSGRSTFKLMTHSERNQKQPNITEISTQHLPNNNSLIIEELSLAPQRECDIERKPQLLIIKDKEQQHAIKDILEGPQPSLGSRNESYLQI